MPATTEKVSKKRKVEETKEGPQKNADGEYFFDLGNKKRVTVREFKGNTLIDIREFYEADGGASRGDGAHQYEPECVLFSGAGCRDGRGRERDGTGRRSRKGLSRLRCASLRSRSGNGFGRKADCRELLKAG